VGDGTALTNIPCVFVGDDVHGVPHTLEYEADPHGSSCVKPAFFKPSNKVFQCGNGYSGLFRKSEVPGTEKEVISFK